ncbi:homoserine kinase [Spirosoma luteolum]
MPVPVTSSIIAPDFLAQFLQQRYALGDGVTCRLLKAGVNHSYRVQAGAQAYVFRIYSLNWRMEVEISEEIRLLDHVRAGGIPVSYALPDPTGQYLQPIDAPEGLRYGVLFSFAPGQKILTFPAEQHEQLGRTMARFHQLTAGYTLERIMYTAEPLLVESLNVARPFFAGDSAEWRFLNGAQTTLLAAWATADWSQLPVGAVHLDIWFDNMSFDAAGQATLFDFDFCGNGPLALDVGYYLMQLHSTEGIEADFLAKRARFLAGYESVRPLTEEEKRLLPVFSMSIYLYYLGVQCQRFDNWSNVFINEVYLQRFVEMRIKRWFDYNELRTAEPAAEGQ